MKGWVYILNINKVDKKEYPKHRKGSDIDVANIKHLFEELGYIVEVHNDLTVEVIYEQAPDEYKWPLGTKKNT